MELYTPTSAEIAKYSRFDEIKVPKQKALINKAFERLHKGLINSYYETTKPSGIYIMGDYLATAITLDLDGTMYVCKFAVHPVLQSNGHGTRLMKHILDDIKIEPENNHGNSIILRSDVANDSTNLFYLGIFSERYLGSAHGAKSSNGTHKWIVHQIGLQGEDLERKIRFVADLPITMVPFEQN